MNADGERRIPDSDLYCMNSFTPYSYDAEFDSISASLWENTVRIHNFRSLASTADLNFKRLKSMNLSSPTLYLYITIENGNLKQRSRFSKYTNLMKEFHFEKCNVLKIIWSTPTFWISNRNFSRGISRIFPKICQKIEFNKLKFSKKQLFVLFNSINKLSRLEIHYCILESEGLKIYRWDKPEIKNIDIYSCGDDKIGTKMLDTKAVVNLIDHSCLAFCLKELRIYQKTEQDSQFLTHYERSENFSKNFEVKVSSNRHKMSLLAFKNKIQTDSKKKEWLIF